jgi:2-oxoglutarate dehydrogenase E2 component (dihydrolipoamide succinyltransferase)
MAIVEIKVPQLSESVAEATLLQWHKQVGQAVARDENLIDIETDKVVLELPAFAAGVLTKILKADGSTVASGEIIALLDTEATATTGIASGVASGGATAVAPVVQASSTTGVAGSPIAMPSAAKMLAETGVRAESVAGTGRDGRVTKGDVLAAQSSTASGAASNAGSATASSAGSNAGSNAVSSTKSGAIPALAQGANLPEVRVPMDVTKLLAGRPEQRVPMSRLRQRVAERLLQSQATNAILTTFNEVNMQPVIDLRKKYQEQFEKTHGVRLGFMSLFVKAAVHALKKFPVVNASVDGTDIVYHGYFDIGVAVGSPRGLVVPVIRDVDQMTFAQVETQISDFGKRAQAGKLGIEELSGGTFSISNGGVFGSMLSTPIINPPQAAILGVHATKDRAVVENGQIVIRPMNYLALSYDHRIIDGREAVLFLVCIKDALEDPARLLLDL